MGKSSGASAPNFAKQYKEGLTTYLKFLPEMLQSEMQYRQQYMPQEIEQQQALQAKYGPTQIAQQLAAFKQMDPQSYALRQALGQSVTGQLARGTQQDPAALAQQEQSIRARQAATGNISGNAPGMAEAVYTGQRGQQLLQQRQAASGTFLQQPMSNYVNAIQGVQAPTANLFVNPQAGYQGVQFGLQNFQNQMAQSQAQGNPWSSALGGAAAGAQLGTAVSPGYGTAIGAVAGGLAGFFSDARLKENVSRTGKVTRDGIPIIEFNYKWSPQRLRGVLAEDVQQVLPDAVYEVNGYKTVNYAKLGIRLEEA